MLLKFMSAFVILLYNKLWTIRAYKDKHLFLTYFRQVRNLGQAELDVSSSKCLIRLQSRCWWDCSHMEA